MKVCERENPTGSPGEAQNITPDDRDKSLLGTGKCSDSASKEVFMQLVNKFNPGGVRATLERWYSDPHQQDRWVTWDGVSVGLTDSVLNLPDHVRSICLVKELGGVVGENAHLTLNEFLYNDY